MESPSDISDKAVHDLLIVGGGINGAGIARDAAGRGLDVVLVEQNDLAAATSSASSKLVHGGLRYLEHFEFRLVREALAEREVLLSIAPHIIWPLTFVLPHDADLRPVWMIRAGLLLYDHLAPRGRLPASRGLDLATDLVGRPLQARYRRGFSYADCWVEDSRLVVLNALDAAERGADIRTGVRFVSARSEGTLWSATVENRAGVRQVLRARILVNAAGPWVEGVRRSGLAAGGTARVRLVKGSHIVVPRLYDGEEAYILQNSDRRIVFVIPYERDFTLVGTTDVPFDGDPTGAAISPEEVAYLCAAANRFLAEPITAEDVVWSFSGVRPLQDDSGADPSTVTRDYAFDLQTDGGRPPALSVFGGKITTYRRLAEHALARLSPHLPALRPPWTARAPLPGGDLPGGDFDRFLGELGRRYPWLPGTTRRRLARAYGTRVERLLGESRSLGDLGEDLGCGLSEREVAYLTDVEWAESAEDVLWRRTKLGLHGGPALAEHLARHLADRSGARPARVKGGPSRG